MAARPRPAPMELSTPEGRPAALAPLHHTSATTTASPCTENFKFARTVSAASTHEPQSPLGRQASCDTDSLRVGGNTDVCGLPLGDVRFGESVFPIGHFIWEERREWDGESPRSPPPSECSTQTGSMGPDDIQTLLPALTPTGQVLSFEGKAATDVGFCSDVDPPTWEQQVRARVAALRAVQQARIAHQAKALVESGDVCPIDSTGVLHGELRLTTSGIKANVLKMFRAKRMSRQPKASMITGFTVFVGPDGRVRALLEVPPPEERRRNARTRRGAACAETCSAMGSAAWAVDVFGCVQFD